MEFFLFNKWNVDSGTKTIQFVCLFFSFLIDISLDGVVTNLYILPEELGMVQ